MLSGALGECQPEKRLKATDNTDTTETFKATDNTDTTETFKATDNTDTTEGHVLLVCATGAQVAWQVSPSPYSHDRGVNLAYRQQDWAGVRHTRETEHHRQRHDKLLHR
jgi:hypothetical protein